ncbi:MAG: type I methionyl aminopeptidase [Candidatus Methylacidiphilales bacterium]|nr:type I methionyl aminopeptidase [Candidatus Methylacidiphilales bacterium]
MIPIKRAQEIDSMRRSGQAVAEVLDALMALVQPGITTGEIDAEAAKIIRARGGKSPFHGYRGFPGHICISVNEEVVHGIGGRRKLVYGDLVKLDVGIVLDGWVGDTAASVPVGAVAPEVTRLCQQTERALAAGIDKARAGNRLGDIGCAIEKNVSAAGYSVVKEFVGHGVGRSLHEEPQIPNYGKAGTGPLLKPGMTLAIEPMVNLGRSDVRILGDGWTVVAVDGKFSSHFEHTVLVTEGDPEILTCRKVTALK